MRLYQIDLDDGKRPQYVRTLKECVPAIKGTVEPLYMPDVRVDLVDVQVDHEGVVHMLNGVPVIKVLRTWRGTRRGGLKEIEPRT